MRSVLRTAAAVAGALALTLMLCRPAEADAVRVKTAVRGETARLTLLWPRPITFEATSADGTFELRFARPAEADFAAAAANLRRFLGPPRPDDDGRTLRFPLRPGVMALTLADGKRVVVDLFASTEDAEAALEVAETPIERAVESPSSALAVPAEMAMMRPVPAPNRRARAERTSPQAGASPGAEDETPGAHNDGETETATLRFDWTEPVAAAIFRRAGALWIVFDRPSVQDLAALRTAAGTAVRAIEQRPHPRATILRFELDGKAKPTVSRDALAWIVTLAVHPPSPPLTITPVLREDADGSRSLVLPVVEPGAPIALTDPAIGDSLVVVPTVPLGAGLHRAYAYPQVRLLASGQGFVIRPVVDDLRVQAGREAVEINTVDGLAVTLVDEEVAARARLRSRNDGATPSGLAARDAGSLRSFTTVRQDLEAAIAARKTGEDRERLRLRLARHYLGHGFAAEALAALQLAERDRPKLATDAGFLSLRGIAHALLGRDAEAGRDFNQPSLASSVEAAAWRASLSESGDSPDIDPQTLAAQAAIAAGYPKPVREALLPRLAEVAIDRGNPALATKLVGLVAAEAESAGERAQARYLDGRRLAANGDVAGALEVWQAVEDGPDPQRRSRVRAADARVRLALAEKKMSADEAIDRLDSLSFAWRGDGLEFSVLSRLGDLYLDKENYAAALRILRRAATNFPEAARNAGIPAKMTRAFTALFVGKDAARRPPLEAIALYDEYRELTPAGAAGDAVIAAVAERMIALDLLGRAAALLDSQVRYRLSGAQRAKAGARLAEVHLLDGKPKAALQALTSTAEPTLPQTLAGERRLLEARALARLQRADEALARLKGTETAAAAAVRADVYWTMKDWRRAAAALTQVLKASAKTAAEEPASAGAGMTADTQADSTLYLAVALALAGEEAALGRLGTDSGEHMASSRWRDVFPLITGRTMAEADLRALARTLEPVDRFRAFLAGDAAAR